MIPFYQETHNCHHLNVIYSKIRDIIHILKPHIFRRNTMSFYIHTVREERLEYQVSLMKHNLSSLFSSVFKVIHWRFNYIRKRINDILRTGPHAPFASRHCGRNYSRSLRVAGRKPKKRDLIIGASLNVRH